MKKNRQWVLALSIIAAFFLISLGIFLGRGLVASAETSNGTTYYFPIIAKNYPAVTLREAWTGDLNRQPKDIYYFNDPITYVSSGMNSFDEVKTVNLSWVQKNACGSTEIFTDMVNLPPGEWTHVFTNTVPSCSGTFTNTFAMISGNKTSSIAANFDAFIHPIELTSVWTGDQNQQPKDAFFFGDPISYIAEGVNNQAQIISVDFRWEQESLCGVSEIFSDTLNLAPGSWMHVYTSTVPTCARTYTNTVQVATGGYTTTMSMNYEGRFPSGIVINTQQAFDKCALPTVGQMQTWWDNSPYVVHNIYLGGVHYACPSGTLNASWMQAVAQQGWAFILTWVGPQAPCTTYAHRISYDLATAYSQGINEAAAALAKAESIGLSGDKILYYDMESYAGADTSCRNAVKSFLKGWTEWIQLQGDKAGAYGSPCYYMMDWWSNVPRPDDVWIASWLTPAEYRPDATVWNVACMNNTYWPGQQRLRQYAGGHVETWGGVSFSIDSNVLNGEITAITTTLPASAVTTESVLPSFTSGQVRDIGLITPEFGWALQDNRLLSTSDGGISWNDITPTLGDSAILDVEFQDSVYGWVVTPGLGPSLDGGLILFKTRDGGSTWESSMLQLPDPMIAAAYLEFIDSQTGWLVAKLSTGNNFSLGHLFATRDGGQTWEERTIPLGEPVRFVDDQHGWVAGGPTGDQLFTTGDGGLTWQAQPLTNLPTGQIFVGLPEFTTSRDGSLPVTVLASPRSAFLLYKTSDSGTTWTLLDTLPLDTEPGTALPFSVGNGDWWAASPDTSELIRSPGPENNFTNVTKTNLPTGIIKLDFLSEQVGWALVQDGVCQGDKTSLGQAIPAGVYPFECRLISRIFITQDGGLNWTEITP
jgi:photosystem II stability/assembly factor-like uncharacterized protein